MDWEQETWEFETWNVRVSWKSVWAVLYLYWNTNDVTPENSLGCRQKTTARQDRHLTIMACHGRKRPAASLREEWYGVGVRVRDAAASTLIRLQPYWASMGRATASCGLPICQTTKASGIGSGLMWGMAPTGRRRPAQLGRQYASSYGGRRTWSWRSHSLLRGFWHFSIYSNCSSTWLNVNIVNIE